MSAAFHTPLLSAAAEAMREFLAGIPFARPRLPVYSNTTGQRHAEEPDRIRALLGRHFREPVLFEQEVRQLRADGARVFLEVGPGKVLTDLVSRILRGKPMVALAVDAPGREGWTQLGHLLARLAVFGLPIRLEAWFAKRGLSAGSLADFIAQARAATTTKATDWILNPNKASPFSVNDGTPTADNGQRTTREASMTTTNGVATGGPPVGTAEPAVPTTSDLFAQFQATTRLMLEAQQAQNRVLERYLEMQERLLLHCSQNTVPQPVAKVTAPPPVAAERSASTASRFRPPVPIPRSPAASPRPPIPPSAHSSKSISNGAHAGAENGVHVNGSAKPAPAIATNDEGPPPTEAFRRDLLDIVSVRTGYPIDALDVDLALEAELGIDSIKTVEIFSNLKRYHAYFRAEEQEEEELLTEFTKLKTLRDIIDSYDRRRQTLLAACGLAGAGAIERYVVTSVAAPLEANGEKKNGRRESSS